MLKCLRINNTVTRNELFFSHFEIEYARSTSSLVLEEDTMRSLNDHNNDTGGTTLFGALHTMNLEWKIMCTKVSVVCTGRPEKQFYWVMIYDGCFLILWSSPRRYRNSLFFEIHSQDCSSQYLVLYHRTAQYGAAMFLGNGICHLINESK